MTIVTGVNKGSFSAARPESSPTGELTAPPPRWFTGVWDGSGCSKS